MAKQPRLYTRLTRAATSVGSYKSLWLGSDHLLVVNSTGYSEEYRRIQFRDIKAFFTIPSDRRMGWTFAWSLIGGVAALVMIGLLISGTFPVFSLIFTVLGAGGLVWNLALGPGCKVYVVTGVQTLQLPSLVRRKKAEKVLARLNPLIAGAQAGMQPPPPPAPPPDDPTPSSPPPETAEPPTLE